MTQNVREGALTAAQDFAEARLRINEKNRLIADAKLGLKHVNAALAGTILAEIIAVVALCLLRLLRSSPLQLSLGSLGLVDAAAVVLAIGALGLGFRTFTRRRRKLGDLRLELAQLREAERDARSRMPAGNIIRVLWTYHSDVLSTIDEHRSARGYRRVHNPVPDCDYHRLPDDHCD